MAAEIKVGIGADVDPFKKGLDEGKKAVVTFDKTLGQLQGQLKNLENGLKSASNSESFARIQRGISAAKDKINQFNTAAKNFGSGSNQAASALTNLGRVAQDAPFGFIGIQNNLNPLLESFQQLRKESGSNSAAFKALGQSLIGPAGIGVALSLVTSAITILSMHPEILTNALNGLTGATNAAAQAQKNYSDALVDSVPEVEGEIANIKSLVSIAKNEQLSRNARLEAVNELNKKYPELNNQIKLEGINSKKTTDAINNLNEALVTRAKIQAVQSLIGDEFKKQLEAQNNSIEGQASAFSKVKAFVLAAGGAYGIMAAQNQLFNSGIEEQDKTLKQSTTKLSTYQKILDGLNTSLAKSGDLFTDNSKAPKVDLKIQALPELKGIGSNVADALLKNLKSSDQKVGEALANMLTVDPAVFAKATKDIAEKGFATLPDIKIPAIDTTNLDKANEKINLLKGSYAKGVELLNAQNEILKQGFQSAFEGIGEAIGTAFANAENPLKALGAAILGTIGDVLVQFGKLTIAAGIAAVGLAQALSHPFDPASGVAAIAAGVALVAIGSAVKSFSTGLSKSGSSSGKGGQSSYSPSVPSGFSPSAPSATTRPDPGSFVMNTVLKGQDILLAVTRTQALNGRTR